MCPLKAILVLKICVNLYLALEPPTPEIVNLRAATDCYLANSHVPLWSRIASQVCETNTNTTLGRIGVK